MNVDIYTETVKSFLQEAQPYSNWGESYFETRVLEYKIIDSLFGEIFSQGGKAALDLGCGLGLACVHMSETFSQVDGTDIDLAGAAFNSTLAPPKIGSEIVQRLKLPRISIHCGDSIDFLKQRAKTYDLIFSHFVLEHVPELQPMLDQCFTALTPGGKCLHIVPNTHDTIIQLLKKNMEPFFSNLFNAFRLRNEKNRVNTRLQGNVFTPITHSEFISDYSQQFSINSLEHYLFPIVRAGFKVREIKPVREHAYGILCEKPESV